MDSKWVAPELSSNLAALRGIAACMVVAFHALLVFQLGDLSTPYEQALAAAQGWERITLILLMVTNGHAAVIVFFVLSGVVLSLSYERQRGHGQTALLAYYLRRGARLWPLLAVTAVLALLLREGVRHLHDPGPFTEWVNGYFAQPTGLSILLRNMFALDSTLNYPAWTIYIEIAASVLFPLLFLLARTGIGVLALLAGTLLITLGGANAYGVAQYLLCFVAGIALARYGARTAAVFASWPQSLRLAALVLSWAATLSFERLYSPGVHMHPLSVTVMTVGATIIVAHLYFAGPIRGLAVAPLQWLGEISYGIYLWHFPLLIALSQVMALWMPPLEPAQALLANGLLGLLTLALTLLVAQLSHVALEKPCQMFGRRLARAFVARQSRTPNTLAPFSGDQLPARRSEPK